MVFFKSILTFSIIFEHQLCATSLDTVYILSHPFLIKTLLINIILHFRDGLTEVRLTRPRWRHQWVVDAGFLTSSICPKGNVPYTVLCITYTAGFLLFPEPFVYSSESMSDHTNPCIISTSPGLSYPMVHQLNDWHFSGHLLQLSRLSSLFLSPRPSSQQVYNICWLASVHQYSKNVLCNEYHADELWCKKPF